MAAGAATNVMRSAHAAETTAGAIATTPPFYSMDVPIEMKIEPDVVENRSLLVDGRVRDSSLNGLPVSGSIPDHPMIYAADERWLRTLFSADWSTDVLKDAKTMFTRTVEQRIAAGQGGTETYLRYRGVVANACKISVEAEGPIVIGFPTLAGMGVDATSTSIVSGATYTSESEKRPMVAGLDFGSLTVAGYTHDGVQGAEINLTRNARKRQEQAGSLDALGHTDGALDCRMKLNLYTGANFAAMLDAILTVQTEFAVTFAFGSVSGEKYTLAFPKCKFADANPDFSTDDIFTKMDVIAHYDSSGSSLATLTRAIA